MSVKFIVFAVLIVLSFLFIIWAYYIKVEKPKIDDKVVLARESWWKETLGSREFGYNCN